MISGGDVLGVNIGVQFGRGHSPDVCDMKKESTSHDQLFKDLLRAFFREFMELFFLDAAAQLDFSTVTFLDKEVFTDLPTGRQRTLGLVAQVQTPDGKRELVLIHVEVESRKKGKPFRQRRYCDLSIGGWASRICPPKNTCLRTTHWRTAWQR